MIVEATLTGEYCRLLLRIERYEHPQLTTGSDANWLLGDVELAVGITASFTAKQEISILTSEIARFCDELRALDRDLTGEATLHHLQSQLGITIALKAGRGTVAGFVREHIGGALHFEQIGIDQTYVGEALRQFGALSAAYPVRGDPGA